MLVEVIDMDIGKIIKQLRIEKGLTQKELADKIGKSKQMIIKYEKNQSEISTTVLTDISKALGVTSDSILSLANNEIKTVDNSPLRDVAIFLSFFDYTLLPISDDNNIVFLDNHNRKIKMNADEFKQVIEFTKLDFKEWIARILVTSYMRRGLTANNKDDIFDIIYDNANEKTK